MSELIFASDHDTNSGPIWHVERQPDGVTNPFVVRFLKRGRNGTLLDQNAEWHWIAHRWCQHRWVPKSPAVPKWLLAKVENHIRNFQP